MEYICTLILLFFFYSFMGWIIEIIDILIETKKLVNRGFLIGPVVPIYGVGGLIILLFLTKYKGDPIVLYFMSVIIAAVLEYTTSYVMEKVFKNRWWDYSHYKFNINGRICLEILALFGVLALAGVYIINPFVLKAISLLSTKLLYILAISSTIILIVDMIVSFNIIITLKNVSNSVRADSTEIITKKVRKILFGKSVFRRLFESFPNMKIFNKASILKDKLRRDKAKVKQEKIKLKKEKIREKEEERLRKKGKIKKVEKKKKNN